jgi:GT2 family glycosyltransferase
MMGPMPRVSVIVPAYNAQDVIDRCLDAVSRQTAPPETVEIIAVDDGSTDDTPARVQAHPAARLIVQDHAGPAAARNLGVQYAVGEIVLFTDADCAPAPDWIERMVAPFAGSEQATGARAIVGVKGAYLTRQQELMARFVQVEYEEKYDHMARLESIDFVDTYSAGYRRDVFLRNGGFDTTFPDASVEDQEFSFRLAGQGYRMVFVPEARVYHWGHAQNLWSYARRKLRIGYWKVLVHRRHPGKLFRDSHTPQSLRVQIVLVGLAGVCLVGSLPWSPLAWGAAISGLAFVLSTIPFASKAWAKDRAVAIVSPFFLLVRALALGTGFAVGVVARFLP